VLAEVKNDVVWLSRIRARQVRGKGARYTQLVDM
jgi:hypothetical protein